MCLALFFEFRFFGTTFLFSFYSRERISYHVGTGSVFTHSYGISSLGQEQSYGFVVGVEQCGFFGERAFKFYDFVNLAYTLGVGYFDVLDALLLQSNSADDSHVRNSRIFGGNGDVSVCGNGGFKHTAGVVAEAYFFAVYEKS